MFKYPDLKPAALSHVEQVCSSCKNWFALTPEDVKVLEKDWAEATEGEFVPFRAVRCTCGHATSTILPGKYDKPGTPQAKCKMQYVVYAGSAPTSPREAALNIARNLCKMRGATVADHTIETSICIRGDHVVPHTVNNRKVVDAIAKKHQAAVHRIRGALNGQFGARNVTQRSYNNRSALILQHEFFIKGIGRIVLQGSEFRKEFSVSFTQAR